MKRIVWLIAFILFLAVQAYAATETRYVRTDCPTNGNGTASSCAGALNGPGAYTSLAKAFNDILSDYPDLVSADKQIDLDLAGTAVDSDTNDGADIFLDSLGTDATHFLNVFTQVSNRHDGKWNTGKYRISNGGGPGAIRVHNVRFLKFNGLQIENTRTLESGGANGAGIFVTNSSGTSGFLYVDNTILRYSGDYTNQQAIGIMSDPDGITNFKRVFRNNIVYNFKKGIEARTDTGDTDYLYNNTCVTDHGVEGCYIIRGVASATIVAKNNIAQGTTPGFDISAGAATWTHSNNLSADTSSPDNTYDSQTVIFVGAADFHLDPTDTAAIDQGVDLSAVTEGFTTDIDSQTRVVIWDQGADDATTSGGGGPTPTPSPTPTPGPTPTPLPVTGTGCNETQNFDTTRNGVTSKCFNILVQDVSTCQGMSGIAFDTAGLTCSYREEHDTSTHVITLNDSNLGTYSTGGFKETGIPGWYEFCVPDESLDGGAGTSVVFQCGGVFSMSQVDLKVGLSPQSDVGYWAGRAVSSPLVDGQPRVTVSVVEDDAIHENSFLPRNMAQAATASTIQLAAEETFGDNALAHNTTVHIVDGTTGAGQSRCICSNIGATDMATLCENWQITPTGAIYYRLDNTPNCDRITNPSVTTGTAQSVTAGPPAKMRLAAATTSGDNVLQDNVSILILTSPGNTGAVGQVLCVKSNTLSNDEVTFVTPWKTGGVPAGTVTYAVLPTPNCNLSKYPVGH